MNDSFRYDCDSGSFFLFEVMSFIVNFFSLLFLKNFVKEKER